MTVSTTAPAFVGPAVDSPTTIGPTTAATRWLPGPPMFTGAMLPVCGIDVLIVVVRPWIMADTHEANLYVVAFQYRFGRAIVLMAQDPNGIPTYYGPARIVNTICSLPFEIIPWQRIPYRVPKPQPWRLPIPPEPPPHDTTTGGYSASLEELASTRIYDAEERARERDLARTTKR